MLSYKTESDSSEVCRDLHVHYVRWLIIRIAIMRSLLVAPRVQTKHGRASCCSHASWNNLPDHMTQILADYF